MEIAAALERDILVIPVLVEDAVDRLLAAMEPILRPPAPLPETRNVGNKRASVPSPVQGSLRAPGRRSCPRSS